LRRASPVILEPMMAVEVETPEDYAGTVMGDLSSRRGMVQGMDDIPAAAARSSRPKCPVGNVRLLDHAAFGTQGRATYTMEFKHYSEAPKNVIDAIVTAKAK
jgi:elongation factor G